MRLVSAVSHTAVGMENRHWDVVTDKGRLVPDGKRSRGAGRMK